jgi:glycosyltransferase involved in cell wall biosynthesis
LNQANHKVLMIAPEFPPSCGGGVQRSLKFARYLPEFGWEPVVLTRDPEREGARLLDHEMVAEVGDMRIERVAHRNPFEGLNGASRWLATLPGPLKLLGLPLKYLWAPVPEDPYYWWCRRVRRTALRLVREEGPAVIYSSGPPHSAHLLGLWLKCRTRLPLVCDFRDPWSMRPLWAAGGFSRRVDRRFERNILRNADVVVCNNEPMKNAFARLEPSCETKLIVITNGFDAADFEGLERSGDDSERPTRLVHAGFAVDGAAAPLLRALAVLRTEAPERAGRICVDFIGGLGAEDKALRNALELSDQVNLHPRVSHREVLREMADADILLLMLPNQEGWEHCTPGKTFELMASGRPVLAILPEGVAAELVRKSCVGVSLRPDDESVLLRLLKLCTEGPNEYLRVNYHPLNEFIASYERRQLTLRLAAALEKLAVESLDRS